MAIPTGHSRIVLTAIGVHQHLSGGAIAFSEWLDNTPTYEGISEEAALWRRSVGKLSEEVGEVSLAILGMLGENPRKGVTNGPEKVEKELLDVAFAALGAIAHMHGNKDVDVARLLAEHAVATCERVEVELPGITT